jgi:hypothetical protein
MVKVLLRLLRYAQLVERNIVKSREQLSNLIKYENFPPGRLESPNCRTWTEEELADWYDKRPVERDPKSQEQKLAALKKAHHNQQALRTGQPTIPKRSYKPKGRPRKAIPQQHNTEVQEGGP